MHKEKGFTLIELMIVVAIIGILAAIAIPQFAAYRTKSFNASAQSDLRNGMTSEEAYFASEQVYFGTAVSNGAQNTTYDVIASSGVTLTLATSGSTYTGTAKHSSGNKTYSVTGSVGIIR